jgi:iron complex outermembrane receptor protein
VKKSGQQRIAAAGVYVLILAPVYLWAADTVAEHTDQVTESPPATAASTAGGGLEEIVVTAERRKSTVQDTPLAITAVDGTKLQDEHVTGFDQLSTSIPNLNFSENPGSTGIFIRGIGLSSAAPGADPRVAIYTDDVYNARSPAGLNSFFDIDRIEVLSGPQGTLYGRNATAGAINILSRNPGDTLNGYGTVTVGNYDLIQTEGAVGGPITDTVGGRLAALSINHSGYGVDIEDGLGIDDANKRAVRGKLEIKPSEIGKILLTADYFREYDRSSEYHDLGNAPGHPATSVLLGFSVPSNPRDYAGQDPLYLLENEGLSANASFHLDDFLLTSVTGYKHLLSNSFAGASGGTDNYLPVDYTENSDMYTEELRLARSFSFVDTLVGAYFYRERNFAQTQAGLSGAYFGFPSPALLNGVLDGGTQWTDAYAAFTQETIHITKDFGIDLGLRYSNEKRNVDEYAQTDLTRLYPATPAYLPSLGSTLNQGKTWNSVDPKANFHYKLDENVLIYVMYSRGFKSGGFNIGSLQNPSFNPETLIDYEAGIKADFLDRRLRTDFSAFHYNYTNLQLTVAQGIQLLTENAGAARLDGFEAQITVLPVDNLRLDFNVAWLDAYFTKYQTENPLFPTVGTISLADNRLPYAPRLKVNTEAAYTFATPIGKITPRAEFTWTSYQYFDQYNVPYVAQGAYGLGDLYVDYKRDNGWSASVYVKNVTDKLYAVLETSSSLFDGGFTAGALGAPRTFGVSVSKQF